MNWLRYMPIFTCGFALGAVLVITHLRLNRLERRINDIATLLLALKGRL